MGFNNFNPCICCQAEVGVYVMVYFQQLFMTGALVMGGALGFTTFQELTKSDSDVPFYRKATLLSIFIMYVICCCLEIGLHEYLHKALNLNKKNKLRRCRRWVTLKVVLYFFAIPLVCVHLFVDQSPLKIILYFTASVYQPYYIWVVHHYTVDIREEIDSAESKEDTDGTSLVQFSRQVSLR